MKKIYLVKKDPTLPGGKDNWTIMSGRQFMQFLDSPQSEGRKKNFAQLDACSEADFAIVMETEGGAFKAVRKDHDRNSYVWKSRKQAAAAGRFREVPLEDAESFSGMYGDDPVCDLVSDRIRIEKLRSSIKRLTEDEQRLIWYCLLAEEPVSEREYGDRTGMSRDNVHAVKRRIIRKLSAMLRESGEE